MMLMYLAQDTVHKKQERSRRCEQRDMDFLEETCVLCRSRLVGASHGSKEVDNELTVT